MHLVHWPSTIAECLWCCRLSKMARAIARRCCPEQSKDALGRWPAQRPRCENLPVGLVRQQHNAPGRAAVNQHLLLMRYRERKRNDWEKSYPIFGIGQCDQQKNEQMDNGPTTLWWWSPRAAKSQHEEGTPKKKSNKNGHRPEVSWRRDKLMESLDQKKERNSCQSIEGRSLACADLVSFLQILITIERLL